MRAWAILMMLQGHFIDALLDGAFRNNSNTFYSVWLYFRGMTAPVFFTVSGFIFTYLLVRSPQTGFDNARVKKGIKRGLELLAIGYLLRINLMGLLRGEIYTNFYLVDVLHCIGLSLLLIVAVYLLTYSRFKTLFPLAMLLLACILFLYEPVYEKYPFSQLPTWLANYLTKQNGSVFTIIPWFGYAAIGAFISMVFLKFNGRTHFYSFAITIAAILGVFFIFFSSDLFLWISKTSGIQIFKAVFYNNYLFIRLGDVLLAFSIFMLMRRWLTNPTVLKLGQSTLTIYIIHFIILYGSFTGMGLYQFFRKSLNPLQVALGALAFMAICSFTALQYEKYKPMLALQITNTINFLGRGLKRFF